MSKQVKTIIMRDYQDRIGDAADALVINISALKGTQTTEMRNGLAKKQIRVAVVRNELAKKVMDSTELKPLKEFLTGHSALAYGGQSVVEVAREIVGLMAKMPAIELKGAILDGQVFKGKNGVMELSKFPTREEAQAKVVTLVVSPGRNLLGALKGPGSTVAGLVKAIESKLEKNEPIAKVG